MRKKILVFAASFLDELPSRPAGAGVPARRLAEAAERNSLDLEFRCERNPLEPLGYDEIRNAVAVIADLEQWPVDLLKQAGKKNGGELELIARYGIGYNSVDIEAAADAGIVVTNTPGASAQPTAEWAVALLLGIAGRMILQHKRASAGRQKNGISRMDMKGRTLGIIGTGTIGKQVAHFLKGFEMKILAADPHPDLRWAEMNYAEYTEIQELCSRSDFITLHASGGRQIIGPDELKQMKPTAILVNCARGVLTDNRAVYEAVISSRLYGFALDEPWVYADLPIREDMNIITSPHVGSDSELGKLRMQQLSAEAVIAYLDGQTPKHVVKPG